MSFRLSIGLALIAAAIAAPASAERRVYAGREAAALKCAAYYSYTAHVGEMRGVLSTSVAEAGRELGLYILQRHVSGTWDQKMKAYRQILDRMPVSDAALFRDASTYLDYCEKTFLR